MFEANKHISMEVGGFNDLTQTEDNMHLETLLFKRPKFNPVLCSYVPPKQCEGNSLKVERDATLTIDYLSRGFEGFKDLSNHVQPEIVAKCEQFGKILQAAYVKCIRLYHMKHSGRNNWDNQLYNVRLPDISEYLKDSYFVTESNEQKTRLSVKTNDLINNFSAAMYSLHEKEYQDHAENAFAFMLSTYETYQSLPMMAAWCDVHDLKELANKVVVLNALQLSLDHVCKLAFPAACATCANLLDNLLRMIDFEPGEPHQMLISLPKFDEILLFKRERPLPSLETPKESKESARTTTTPSIKKVCITYVTFLIKCYITISSITK